jgi:hypothetical protein
MEESLGLPNMVYQAEGLFSTFMVRQDRGLNILSLKIYSPD